MEIKLTRKQICDLKDFTEEAKEDWLKDKKGAVHAQVFDGFMMVYYIENKCCVEMREVMKRHYPEWFPG